MNLSSFDCLVALDSDALGLANALVITSRFFGAAAFGPVVDGEFIVERPMLTLGRGRVNGVTYISLAFYQGTEMKIA